MATTTPRDDEIRKILNDEDIERLRKRFLCSLKDMDNNANNSYDFDQVYDRMGLGGYTLPLAMRIVIQDYLLPQGLIQIDGERVRITETGRHRCDQFRHTDDQEWRETMRRMDRYARITDR
ncbi:MAG: hypothetical protein ACJ704_09900 [Nitrososphaeraceae archaeon]|jgi:hypothetical protein